MAPKRPLDDLPAISSSSKEEEEVEDAEDAEEEEHEDGVEEQKQEEDFDSESVGGSDSSPEKLKSSRSSRRSDFMIKPITPKPKKPTSNPTTVTPKKPSTIKAENGSKRSKRKVLDAEEEDSHHEESVKKSGDDSKRPFQRVWSEEDEIVILKGMIDYMKKGHDPNANTDAFLDSIKKSLHIDAHRDQLKDKIRRLKNKYEKYADREKNTKDSTLLKPHELRLYELSKEIWSGKESKIKVSDTNGVEFDSGLASGKRRKTLKANNSAALPKPHQDFDLTENPQVSLNAEEGDGSLYPILSESMRLQKNSTMLLPGLGENLMKEGLSLIGSSKVKELEQKWRKLQISEIQVYLERIELLREQTMLVLDALGSSES